MALGGQGSVGDSPLLPAGPHRTALCPPPACPLQGATASSYAESPAATTLPTAGHPSFLALTMQGPVLTWPLDALHVQQGSPAAPGQTRNGQLSLVPVTPLRRWVGSTDLDQTCQRGTFCRHPPRRYGWKAQPAVWPLGDLQSDVCSGPQLAQLCFDVAVG